MVCNALYIFTLALRLFAVAFDLSLSKDFVLSTVLIKLVQLVVTLLNLSDFNTNKLLVGKQEVLKKFGDF